METSKSLPPKPPRIRLSRWLLLILIMALSIGKAESKKLSSGQTLSTYKAEEEDREEFREFCELAKLVRSEGLAIEKDIRAVECSVTAANEFDIKIDGKMLFTLIMIVAWGAAVRAVIHNFELHVPYTVVLMISGLIIGFISSSNGLCPYLYEYTAIARISPNVILYTFLPILIFESAYSIPVHTFSRSAVQIILVAFPGMVFSTFCTALICMRYFTEYKWSFLEASLFGSIISATDPVAVVAILRELGVSEVLSVMIEGESLLNDGVAILLFEIFKELLEESDELEAGALAFKIFLQFLRIAVGGPVFGWFMARITIFLLRFVFNDATVEISATIVSAYLTYWFSEDVLKVSGVMAVVMLGLTLSAERTVISPESVDAVHHFWEILGYLANTVLFVLVGIVITETALNSIELYDWWNLLVLFVSIHVVRFVMLLLLFPILKRIGYGLTWENMIIMMWGGLRGAVGICLALEVYRGEHLCLKPELGAKMLFQTAGIVFITLVLNGTTTKGLLDILKLTEISSGRKEEMNNAVRRIQKIKSRSVRIFQLSAKMFDADWDVVNDYCTIKNPYKLIKKDDTRNRLAESVLPPQPVRDNTTVCWKCNTLVQNEPTSDEYREMTDDARLRVIKAMKVAYMRMYEVGLISDLAVQILLSDAERVEDQYLNIIHAKNFDKYLRIRGFYPWLKDKIDGFETGDVKPAVPESSWRHPFHWLVTQEWFDVSLMFVVLLNMIPVLWEVFDPFTQQNCEGARAKVFKTINVIFNLIYMVEFVSKILGYVSREYFSEKWNYLDFVVLIVSYVDLILGFIFNCNDGVNGYQFFGILKFLRLLRISRALRLLRPLLPRLKHTVHVKINEQLFLGYDICRGFVHACDEVLKFLTQMIENRRVLYKIKEYIEAERAECLKSMGLLQQKYPGIAIAVKTRHACRSVLNSMRESLQELKDEGLLDDTEFDILVRFLETKMQRLWHSPASIEPFSAHILLANLSWLQNNEELYDTILEAAELMTFGFGESLCAIGDPPSGIFVVVAGMVKVMYQPTPEIIEARNKFGKLPNSELCSDLTFSHTEEDYFSSGFVIGEAGILTGDNRAASVVAETSLVVYHIARTVLQDAMEKYDDLYDSLEGQLWRSVGLRRAAGLIGQLPQFLNANSEKVQTHIQRSSVPIGNKYNVLDIPHYVSEVVVIEGYAKNGFTNEVYVAPIVVNPECTRLLMIDNPATVNRILIIANEELDFENLEDERMDDVEDILKERASKEVRFKMMPGI